MSMHSAVITTGLDPGRALAHRDTSHAVRLPVPGVLRVVADANDLPFSNARGEGFENAIARLVARDLGCRLKWLWWAGRRGSFRSALDSGLADVVWGVPMQRGPITITHPYYRSSDVFVTLQGRPTPRRLDDPALAHMRIGFPATCGRATAVPPAALAARGLGANVRGFPLTSDASRPNPPAALLDALARGEIDAAIAWGPVAGWQASRSPEPFLLTPILQPGGRDIAAGVRHGDTVLRDAIDRSLARHEAAIRALLEDYGVPVVDATTVH